MVYFVVISIQIIIFINHPGLDDVCCSNGTDYARGMTSNMEHVKNDRIAMSVDCSDIDTKWNQESFNVALKYLINTCCSTMNMQQLILQLDSQILHILIATFVTIQLTA